MKKSCLFFTLLLSFFVFMGCEVGMGESPDLEAPEIVILTPEKLSNVHLEFELGGTCYDDHGITEILVSNFVTGVTYGKAEINKAENTWSFPMKLTKADEGEITLLVTASDKAGNESTKSKKTITLLVDDTPPESEDWYLLRGSAGYTIKLYPKAYLEQQDENASVNKDLFQNQEFTIHGKVSDAMSIKETKIILKDENGKQIITRTSAGTYTPEEKFTHQQLVEKAPELATGKHYLQVYYQITDEHNNVTTCQDAWLIWYPESDVPKIVQSKVADNHLEVNVKDQIAVDCFDDDELSEVKVILKNPSELNGITEDDLITNTTKRNQVFTVKYTINETDHKKETLKAPVIASGTRDETVILPADATLVATQMKLVVCTKDCFDNWKARIIDVTIKDEDMPNLYVQTPAENALPTVRNVSKFDVSGYVLDKRDGNGIIKIVYVPTYTYKTTEAQKTRADAILNTETENGTFNASSGAKTYTDGCTLNWKTVTKDNPFTDTTNSGWIKRTFSFEYDLLNDFSGKGAESKYFGLLYTDYNGNETYLGRNVDGDKNPPEITVDSPATDMVVVNPETETLTLRFKASKTTGLGMDDSTYKITGPGVTYTVSDGLSKDGDYYKAELAPSVLQTIQSSTSQPTFEFEVKDKLGIPGTDRRTVVLSVLPKVTSITADSSNGTYKQGEKIRFRVNFDKEVKVTGSPRLVIYYNSSDTTKKYATYTGGTNTKALSFEYTVPANVEATKIRCPNTGYLNIPSGAKIETTVGTGNAQTNQPLTTATNLKDSDLKIDSIAPSFSTIKITANGTSSDSKKYVKADDEITAVLTATESVMVSGSPSLVLKSVPASGSSDDLTFDFRGRDGNTVTFVHKVKSSSPNGTVGLNGTSYFTTADAQIITDTIGNKLSVTELTLVTGSSGSDTVIIDTAKPAKPTLKLKSTTNPSGVTLSAGTKTEAQTLIFSGLEANGTAYYSLNGGSSWKEITDTIKTNGVELPDGVSNITAKQYDIAGNESDPLTAVSVNVQPAFPAVTGLTITNANGYYKTGDVITINVTFDEPVILTTAGANLTFTNYAGGGSGTAAFATTGANGLKTLTATHTVTANEVFNGIKITGLNKGALKDANGHTPGNTILNSFLNEGNGWRQNIKIDAEKPTLSSTVPANNGVSAHRGTSDDKFVITLNFSEPVYKESGYITLQRIGVDTGTNKDNWAIPAIIELEDFTKIYNNTKLSATDRETLLQTQNGAEKLQDYTARPLGPYMKYTHGINDDGSPDQTTRYVLAPEYGLFNESTGTVAAIRSVLEKTDYHKHKVDINSNQVTGEGTTQITITFNDRIEDGQHWVLIIDSTALRDSASNYYDGLTYEAASYTFWSKQVAEPVVRVDRYSHNIGASEPNPTFADDEKTQKWKLVNADGLNPRNITQWNDNGWPYTGTGNNVMKANSAGKLAPTGYAKVRIDCETPGAVLKFNVYTDAENNGAAKEQATVTHTNTSAYHNCGTYSDIKNVAKTSMSAAPDNTYTLGQWIVVGDGLYTTARKDYVYAKATSTTAVSGMAASDTGYEGVFKTLVQYYNASSQGQIQIQGGTFNGGMPSIPGFPLRDAVSGTTSQRYNQNSYQASANSLDHYWVTYDIVSEYSILSVRGTNNWSVTYNYGAYGQISYIVRINGGGRPAPDNGHY